MPRFVFRQKSGEPARSVAEVAEHATRIGAQVLSQTATMLYIEASEDMLRQISAAAPGYVSTAEVTYQRPKPPRVGIKRGPGTTAA